jgi:hypothetical protein
MTAERNKPTDEWLTDDVTQSHDVPKSKKKPNGYWKNPEAIVAEAKKFVEIYGELKEETLNGNGYSSLLRAIRLYYEGSIHQLRMDLGLENRRKREKYWTPENIEAEAKAFYEAEGDLSLKLLLEKNRTDLRSTIVRRYPGGIRALTMKLGLGGMRKEKDYWKDPGTIEQEAKRFYKTFQTFFDLDMNREGYSSLCKAIYKYYPGGKPALVEKLGIQMMEEISVNEQLLVEYEALLANGIAISFENFLKNRS